MHCEETSMHWAAPTFNPRPSRAASQPKAGGQIGVRAMPGNGPFKEE